MKVNVNVYIDSKKHVLESAEVDVMLELYPIRAMLDILNSYTNIHYLPFITY